MAINPAGGSVSVPYTNLIMNLPSSMSHNTRIRITSSQKATKLQTFIKSHSDIIDIEQVIN